MTRIVRTLSNGQQLVFSIVRRVSGERAIGAVEATLDGESISGAGGLCKMSAAELTHFGKLAQGLTHMYGRYPVFAHEVSALEAAVAAEPPVATVADYPGDAQVQAAHLTAQETGERAHVRGWVEDVERPRIESSQDLLDLYVEPDGTLTLTTRHAY